jgi:hypothetical protein
MIEQMRSAASTPAMLTTVGHGRVCGVDRDRTSSWVDKVGFSSNPISQSFDL